MRPHGRAGRTEMHADDDRGGANPALDQIVDGLVKTLRPRFFPTAIPGLDDATVRRLISDVVLLRCGAGGASLDRIRATIDRALPDVPGRDPGPVDEAMARIREYVKASFWTDE
jgi:hypothetical protein